MKNITSLIIGIVIIIAVVFFALQYKGAEDQRAQLTPSPTVSASSNSGFTLLAPSITPDTLVSPAPSSMAKVATVSVDDEGFSPSTVTIAAGTTVIFANNGQALHWVASDPHPTHTGLSGLDSKKGLTTGEVYSFTFTKQGTFGLHDHLHTSIKGTIIVQ